MESLAIGGAGAFIIDTIIKTIKPLLPTRFKPLIPLFALTLGVVYGLLTVEGIIETKLAVGISVGAGAIAGHESSKVFRADEEEAQESIHNTESLQLNG